MDKVKVLYTLTNLSGGGAEKVATTLLSSFNSNKYDFDLFLHTKEGPFITELPKKINLIYLLKERKNSLLSSLFNILSFPVLFIKLILLVPKYKLLICGLEATYVTYATIIAGSVFNLPVVVLVHTDISSNNKLNKGLHLKILKYLYPYCRHFVCVSEGVLRGLIGAVPKIADRVSVINNPYDLEKIVRRSKEPIEFNEPFLISVGRLDEQKRFDRLIYAYKKSLEKGINHPLVIVGEGKCRYQLEQLIKESSLEEKIHLIGFKLNPHKWVAKADCFILSSDNEGFPNVIVEALSVGTPVISTDCPSGPFEILEGGKYGVLVKNEDAEALSNAIVSICNNPEKRQYFKKVSKERSQAFSPQNAIAKWTSLLDSIL